MFFVNKTCALKLKIKKNAETVFWLTNNFYSKRSLGISLPKAGGLIIRLCSADQIIIIKTFLNILKNYKKDINECLPKTNIINK